MIGRLRSVERVNRYKPFRILIEITLGSAVLGYLWDEGVKSFGILIGTTGEGGRWRLAAKDHMSRFGIPLGWVR